MVAPTRVLTLVFYSLAVLAATGCGGGELTAKETVPAGSPTEPPRPRPNAPTPPEPPPPASVGWEPVLEAARPTDSAVSIAANAGTTVVVAGRDGAFQAYTARDGRGYRAARTPTHVGQPSASAAIWTGEAFLAAGADFSTYRPAVWRSSDGWTWQRVEAKGLERPGDVNALVATASGVVAAGALRLGDDPGSGPFRAAVWRSADGTSWELTELPGGRETHAIALARVGDRLLAAGADGRQAALWRSDDEGASWERVPLVPLGGLEYSALSGLAVAPDGTLVIVGVVPGELVEQPVVLVSRDGGVSFEQVPLDPLLWARIDSPGRLTEAGGRLWLTGVRTRNVLTDPDACYASPAACEIPEPYLLASEDGRSWRAVELADALAPGIPIPTAVGEDADGRVLVASTGDHLTVAAWNGSASALPLLPPPAPGPQPDLPLARPDGVVEPGVTYRFPLHTHCGTTWLGRLNGSWWRLRSGGEVGADWPMAGESVLGLVTLVDGTTIEYSLPGGEVIATYVATTEEPPGCA